MASTGNMIGLHDEAKLRGDVSRIQSLPCELLAKIFHLLGMKQTAQLQCVSKRWCELFHQQNFVQLLYSQRLYLETEDEQKIMTVFSTSLTNLILHDVSAIEFDCISLSRSYDGYLAGSANGVLCIKTRSHCPPSYALCCGLTLTTPAMRVEDWKWLLNMPRIWFPYLFGFGYEFHECDYKILYVAFAPYGKSKQRKNPRIGRVYSLKHNSWKDVDYPFSVGPHIVHYTHAKYSNGGLYWLLQNATGGQCLQKFDLYKDEFTSSTSLVLPDGAPERVHLTTLNGDISVYSLDNEMGKFDLWVPGVQTSAKRSGTEFTWTKLFSLVLPELKSKIFVAVTHLTVQQQVVLFVRGKLVSDCRTLLVLWYHLSDRKAVRIAEVSSTIPEEINQDLENMLAEGEETDDDLENMLAEGEETDDDLENVLAEGEETDDDVENMLAEGDETDDDLKNLLVQGKETDRLGKMIAEGEAPRILTSKSRMRLLS